MEQLKAMKESLVACAQSQMGNLDRVNAKELGAVVDMIKDLSEAEYYCGITKAMENRDKTDETQEKIDTALMMERLKNGGDQGQSYYGGRRMSYPMYGGGRMYYDGPYTTYPDRTSDYYGRMSYDSGDGMTGNSSSGNSGNMSRSNGMRDSRDGRAYMGRRGYMESKENHMSDTVKLERLQEYIHELGSDITEMIADATPQEKTMLKEKLTSLAQKIA